MGKLDGYPVVDLTRPHGFLVWKGKQTVIASSTKLFEGEVMVTSDGEMFGIATLGQPSQVNLSEFEREAHKHRIRPEERTELWPDANSFYLYPIKEWRGFSHSRPITITLQPDVLNNGAKDISTLLESVQVEPSATYDLVLMQVKKKEVAAMPYEINEEECVVNTESGEVEKCHDTHEEAMAHLAALNINVTKAEKMEGQKRSFQQLMGIQERFLTKFCRNDYDYRENPWPVDITDDSKIIANWRGSLHEIPFTIADNGEIIFTPQNQWTPVHTEYVAGAAKAGRRLASSMLQRLKDAKDALIELAGWAEYADQEPEEEMMMDMLKSGTTGVAIKMVGGEPWHLSWSSNSFKDRDGEIFSLKSLEQYVRENEENEVKGYFNLWHIRGTDFAEKRFQAIVGKFLFEAGPYLKDEKGHAALKFFKEYSSGHPEIAPEGWGASVEYRYLPEERKNKIYEWTWITRTSTLARGAAANVWTKASQEEFTMNNEQLKAANAIFGEEFTNKLVASGEQKTAELEQAGVANKSTETPEGKEEKLDVTQLVEQLSTKMMGNLNEALVPVLTQFHEQITALGEQVTTLGTELKQLKSEQAVKESVELPRFTFNAIRASQTAATAVPEGDALKNQKPVEASQPQGGSVAPAYFQTAKR